MASPPGQDAPYKKDLVHNLGYKPIVRAFTEIVSYSLFGTYALPVSYYDREYIEDFGIIILDRRVDYEHINDNTVRFYGQKDMEINVTLFMEPRKDAWYE